MKITGNYNGSNAISVSSGSQSTAVLLNTGEVMTTGYNYYGNLGLGNTNNYNELQSVPPTGNYDGTNAIAVSMGNQHMCILLDTGEVMSCGANDNGYLGNGEDGSMFSSSRDAIKDRLVPMSGKDYRGESHWWLQDENKIYDPTVNQYVDKGQIPPYNKGKKSKWYGWKQRPHQSTLALTIRVLGDRLISDETSC